MPINFTNQSRLGSVQDQDTAATHTAPGAPQQSSSPLDSLMKDPLFGASLKQGMASLPKDHIPIIQGFLKNITTNYQSMQAENSDSQTAMSSLQSQVAARNDQFTSRLPRAAVGFAQSFQPPSPRDVSMSGQMSAGGSPASLFSAQPVQQQGQPLSPEQIDATGQMRPGGSPLSMFSSQEVNTTMEGMPGNFNYRQVTPNGNYPMQYASTTPGSGFYSV